VKYAKRGGRFWQAYRGISGDTVQTCRYSRPQIECCPIAHSSGSGDDGCRQKKQTTQSAMANLFASETAVRFAEERAESMGKKGYGYTKIILAE
jgi:alkylation response protein AidB-like acyl-CoA dehydrogenase